MVALTSVKGREAWHTAIHGVTESQTRLSDRTPVTTHFSDTAPHPGECSSGVRSVLLSPRGCRRTGAQLFTERVNERRSNGTQGGHTPAQGHRARVQGAGKGTKGWTRAELPSAAPLQGGDPPYHGKGQTT